MADVTLITLVADRLEARPPEQPASDLVLAAFQGTDAVAAALQGKPGAATKAAPSKGSAAPPAAFLTGIEVEGFRGVGSSATLHLGLGPGLTLVLGRNGSGKSSFGEALEMLLLGTNQRWKDRPRVWTEGWRNLHHPHARISATFSQEGKRQPLELTRRWKDDAEREDSTLLIDGRPRSLDDLGWPRALSSYPPLLSHHELETALDKGPSALYDALAVILGLGDLSIAQETLRDARLALEQTAKTAANSLQPLRQILEQTEDKRAAAVLTALKGKAWDLADVETAVAGAAIASEQSVLRRLRDLASVPVVESELLNRIVAELRAAHQAVERLQSSDAARAHELAELLQHALDVHAHGDGDACPVCGTEKVLTYEWRLRTANRVKELRSEAAAADDARRQLTAAMTRARQLVTSPPAVLRETLDLSVDVSAVLAAWQRWVDVPAPDDPVALSAHLATVGPQLIAAVADLRRTARSELERRERSWRPAAEAILQWLPMGRAAQGADPQVKRLKAAERWLREAHDEIRDERFRPIAQAVQDNWTQLRQDSNVTLGELKLQGAANQRRLTLDVRVDGAPSSALGVMSQGELNCLALSLFLPRASMQESPFRFLVIDDPVQAMDPAKVEGLAVALARAAESRQVIVFTHDTRLADAVRFLDLKATVVEVVRRENSVVELRCVRDPVQQYIDDAFAVAMTEGLPPEAVRVIPGFCRFALEAACSRSVRHRLLRQGVKHAEVQAALEGPTTLMMWLALALLDDSERSGDVMAYLQREHPNDADAVRECNRGAHSGRLGGNLLEFVRSVERLTKVIAPPEMRGA